MPLGSDGPATLGCCSVVAQETHPGLDRLTSFFSNRGWTPFAFQTQAWEAYLEGRSGLISVPTGAGKTYAAYGGPLADLIGDGSCPNGHGGTRPRERRAIRILYVTPLRAVSRDIELALRLPIAELGLPFEVESRTGDTTASVRTRQRTNLPEVLITTPESLCLLLSYADAATRFQTLRSVIVDEWHELLASKRGSQVELALARLRGFAPALRTWALSATLGNVADAAEAAVGIGGEPVIVQARMDRPVEIETVLPRTSRELPWAGHMGLRMLPSTLEHLDPDRTTLLFTNTRSQAELWHGAILASRPEWEPTTALHHGSIDRDERERVEAGLKSGALKLVVATSSLDLGVDFSPVEHVFQIGSPKGVARLLQRAGRSGHRPGEPCRVTCVPTHALELFEIAAVRAAIERGEMEPRFPQPSPLDVLAQHMVTCALGGGFRPDELFPEVRAAAGFAELSRSEFDWTLQLVMHGGSTLGAYPEFHKVVIDGEGVARVPSRRIAQLHRMNVGTITGEATVAVRYVGGRSLGSIEEAFVAMLRPGQKFVFAGKVLEFVRLHDLAAYVRPSSGKTNFTPHWAGTKLPISESLGQSVRDTLESAAVGLSRSSASHSAPPGIELAHLDRLVRAQGSMSHVPAADECLVELMDSRDGAHLFVFPFDGRLVHGGIAALLALRLGRVRQTTFNLSANDYGFELLAERGYPFETLFAPSLLSPDNLAADALESVNLSELAKRQFREVARVAGLVRQHHPGAPKGARQLTASSSLIYEVFEQFDPDNLLMHQARREVLERQFERTRLSRTLSRLRDSRLVIRRTARPTPLSFPLLADRFGAKMSHGTLAERIDRMQRALEAEGTVHATDGED